MSVALPETKREWLDLSNLSAEERVQHRRQQKAKSYANRKKVLQPGHARPSGAAPRTVTGAAMVWDRAKGAYVEMPTVLPTIVPPALRPAPQQQPLLEHQRQPPVSCVCVHPSVPPPLPSPQLPPPSTIGCSPPMPPPPITGHDDPAPGGCQEDGDYTAAGEDAGEAGDEEGDEEGYKGAEEAPAMEGDEGTEEAPAMEGYEGAEEAPAMEGYEGAEEAPAMEGDEGAEEAPAMEGDEGAASMEVDSAPPAAPAAEPEAAPAAEKEEEEEDPIAGFVGKRVRRFFNFDGSGDDEDAEQESVVMHFDGTVEYYLPVVEGEFPEELWRIKMDDGDDEDLERAELREAIENHRLDLKERTEGYQLERARNIARNRARLAELGLGQLTNTNGRKRRREAATARRAAELDEQTAVPRAAGTLRTQTLAAKKLSRAEQTDPHAGEPLYRPIDLAKTAMDGAQLVESAGLVEGFFLECVAREGPFKRFDGEWSAEAALWDVKRGGGGDGAPPPEEDQRSELHSEAATAAEGKFLDIDVSSLQSDEAVILQLRSGDSPGCPPTESSSGARGAETSAETDYVYIQKGFGRLSASQAAEASMEARRFPSRLGIKRMSKKYKSLRKRLENSWHEHGWAQWTNDPQGTLRKSTEFGWSVMPGGSDLQKEAREKREPFRLKAWTDEDGKKFYEEEVVPFVQRAWADILRRFPDTAAEMLAALPERYRIANTGISKVTVAINNPTPIHYDDNNFGVTALVAFDLNGNLAPGSGSHVLLGNDFNAAAQVRDDVAGVVTLGDYRRVLHCNRAVVEGTEDVGDGEGEGERLIMTAYCSQALVDLLRE